jgi:catalase
VTAAITHPIPASFATLAYHALHTYGLVADDDTVRYGRYHFVPEAGEQALPDDDIPGAASDYLATELAARLEQGPVAFGIEFELATRDDDINDPTVAWPEDRERAPLGRLTIDRLADDRERDGDVLVFDPTRVPDGVVLSDDTILHARKAAYSVSVARRTGV